MTRPATTRILILEDRRGGSASAGSTPVRRYRLARLAFEAPASDGTERFGYLKRCYD